MDGSLRSRLKNAKEIDSILTSSVIRNLKTVKVNVSISRSLLYMPYPKSTVISVAKLQKNNFKGLLLVSQLVFLAALSLSSRSEVLYQS